MLSLFQPFFPKQFTVGILNSILKCVRLVSGAVSASGRFVFQFICLPIHLSPRSCVRGCVRLRGICLPIHLSPRSCVRGCVRLRGICLPIHLSPNSFVSQVLCQGCVRLRTICLPIHFVSQFICLPGPCLPIHLSPRSLSPNSFVSQVLWQGLCPPPGDWFPNSFVSQFICLPGPVSGAVSAFGGFVSQFVCLPSFPKQLTVGVLNSILRCVRLVSGAVSASLGSVSPIICLPSFVPHVLCQGLRPPPWALCLPSVPKQFTVGVLNSLSSGVRLCSDGGVWLSGCPEFICPLVAIHLSPNLAGGVQLSGCLQFICLPLSQLICFPIWLVVSRSLAVSNSFVCPYINSFVSQSGWWCPALRLSPIHLSPLVATHSPNSLLLGYSILS